MREVIENSIKVQQDLLKQYDAVTAATAERDQINVSLASVKKAHEEAQAQLAAVRATVAEAQADAADKIKGLNAEIVALRAERDVEQAKLDAARAEHGDVLRSFQALRARIAEPWVPAG